MDQDNTRGQKNRRGPDGGIPKTVSQRLSLYLRILEDLKRQGSKTVSSQTLAARLELTAAQVRKDFAYFGQFGSPGVGYKVELLIDEIRKILGTDRPWSVALIGAGRLGNALLRYRGFESQGFHVTAVFDANPKLIGTFIEDLEVFDIERFEDVARDLGLSLAILAIPAERAQDVADRMVQANIRGLLNFAPIRLQLPDSVSLVEVDLAVQLEQLSYLVSLQKSELAEFAREE